MNIHNIENILFSIVSKRFINFQEYLSYDKSMLIIFVFCKHIHVDYVFMKIHNCSFPMKTLEFPSICMNILKYL
jgi:hypothetical protein